MTNDQLFQECIACEGSGFLKLLEDADPIRCEYCIAKRVIPFGMTAAQLEALHRRANNRSMMLAAIISGKARWEWFSSDDRTCGELCVGGMRYTLNVDPTGVPILGEPCRRQLERIVA